MQRQKTIAKWLAVILLLSVALACYIAINAVLKNKNTPTDNVAGADTNQPTINDDPIIAPVYSTLPRRGESVGNLFVRHIGGEDNDQVLDTLFLNGKRYVIFSTQSRQYDTTGNGIYIAVLEEDNVASITKIAQSDEEYVASAITKSGLLIVTQNTTCTNLRLMSSTLATNAICTTKRYEQLTLYSHANMLYALTYDGQFLRHAKISSSLDFQESNFVYEVKNAHIYKVIAYGEKTLAFVNTSNGCKYIIYDETNGFSLKNEMINCDLLQILPLYSNGNQLFFTLTKHDNALTVSSLSTSFQLLAQYEIDNANMGVILPYESGVILYQNNTVYTFCVHLDLLSTTTCKTKLNNEEIVRIESVDGATDMFVVRTYSQAKLCKLVNNDVEILFDCNLDGTPFNANNEQYISPYTSPFFVEMQQSNVTNKTYTMCLTFSAPTTNSFAYMCFGKTDIFVINL